jgi:TolB protein
MTGITHKQARRYLSLAADGLLRDSQRSVLEAHLHGCAACSLEAEKLNDLETHLKHTFHTRWDAQDGPSRNMAASIRPRTRNMLLSNRIKKGLKFLAGVAFLLGVVLVFNVLFSQWKTSPASTATSTILPTGIPVAASPTAQPYSGLIAFVSKKSGNDDIYTMHLDGNQMTNLTNNPAEDYSPAWSPDGRWIAFVSERSGNAEIYRMNPDGSGLSQLTQNPGGYDGYFTRSPDGQKIVYTSSTSPDPNNGQLKVMNADGSGKILLTNETGSYIFLSWSPDDQKILYLRQNLDPNATNTGIYGIYAVNADGTNGQELLETDSISLVQWQDAKHFYAVSGYNPWEVYKFNTDGTPPVLIASYPTPVSTWFGSGSDLNYVVKHFDTWDWYHINGTTTAHLSTWPSFSAQCQEYRMEMYLNDASNWLSPDGKYGVVTVYCDDGHTWFYYVTADGSKIELLLNQPIPLQDIGGDASWSPDGKYFIIDLGNNQTGNSDLYLIDLEKTLQDPNTRPIQLTTDNALKYGDVWQPRP